MRDNTLFSSGDLSATLDAHTQAAVDSVRSIPRDQFLSTTVDTLVEHLVSKYEIEPLQLHEDQITMSHDEAHIDVTGRFEYGGYRDGRPVHAPGHQLTFYVPFTGLRDLFRMRPNMWFSWMPNADVEASRLVIRLQNTSNTDQQWYQSELDRQLDSVRQLIAAQGGLVSQSRAQLGLRIRAAVEKRRAELEKGQALTAGFKFPLVKKPGMPEFKPIEVQRRQVKPLPRPAVQAFKPEPAIPDALYDELLGIIRHAGASYEGTPQTYRRLGEEGLRDNMLSHINVVFEGKATGETFRKYGKTDIRLEEDSRAAFVAECKLWGGEKVLLEALTQLLGYLTWRDSKTALIMFNKDVAGFTGVQETVPVALKSHPNFLREKPSGQAGEWRYVFRSAEDEAKEITVHVFAFNLYVAPARASKKR